MAESTKPYEYFAFISYKREDEKWAKWLQHKLEYYKLPSSVRKDNPDLPDKIRPVFKDTTDLEPGVLAQKIQNALNSSKFLIVICSPRSANSVWVSKEVQSFIDSGRADHIIPFIIGGTPNATDPKDECFPEGLRQLAGEQELLGTNINEMGRDAAAIKVVARMFNLRFDTLWQRYEKERHRRVLSFGIIAIILVVLSLGIVGYISRQNVRLSYANEKIIAERDRAELANKNLETANDSIVYQAKLLSLSNDSLSKINNLLSITIRDLGIERNNVVIKSQELQKEQLRLIAKQAELLFSEGNVLRSYQLIRPMALNIINQKYPYSPEIASLINKIKWYLNEDGYKVIEVLTASENDSVYVSPNLLYNPYTERGKFYLRDVKKGTTIVLPGEDRIDDCDMQFGKNTLYYRGVCNSYMWDIIQEDKIDIPDSHNLTNMDYEDFMNYTLPDISRPFTTHIHSYNDIPDIIDYDIKSIVKKKKEYVISQNNKEILINNQLLSKRILPISFDSGIKSNKSSISSKGMMNRPDSIVYDNVKWVKIDEKGSLKLYKWTEEDDATNARLMLNNERNHTFYDFTPFVAYSTGNGIGYLETAFILNEDEILCVSGQTNHEIYNIRLNTRNLFQYGQIDGWKMSHIGLYLSNAFLINQTTLCDVRQNGQITVYDIPSRLIIDEYDIPRGGWLKNGELSERVFFKDNRINIIYEDWLYEVELIDKIQSLSEDILLIDRFWD